MIFKVLIEMKALSSIFNAFTWLSRWILSIINGAAAEIKCEVNNNPINKENFNKNRWEFCKSFACFLFLVFKPSELR